MYVCVYMYMYMCMHIYIYIYIYIYRCPQVVPALRQGALRPGDAPGREVHPKREDLGSRNYEHLG